MINNSLYFWNWMFFVWRISGEYNYLSYITAVLRYLSNVFIMCKKSCLREGVNSS